MVLGNAHCDATGHTADDLRVHLLCGVAPARLAGYRPTMNTPNARGEWRRAEGARMTTETFARRPLYFAR